MPVGLMIIGLLMIGLAICLQILKSRYQKTAKRRTSHECGDILTPGSGKGTQTLRIAKVLGLPVIATGIFYVRKSVERLI